MSPHQVTTAPCVRKPRATTALPLYGARKASNSACAPAMYPAAPPSSSLLIVGAEWSCYEAAPQLRPPMADSL
ncbi:hypothetical protein NDU88_002048 [Pleurodeles waltl]|uniref:Uncharacterized protein n=1 Tax=Pleurodeles waltl TaxID=8319 RepID=A0AAV7P8U0_PLEWA|nr:hypothetical protein NDU88_002048 [Pleurodeles waltl]